MSKRTYPRYMSPVFCKAKNYGLPGDGVVKCKFCDKPFTDKNENIVVQEIQVNWFRGDDDADYYHRSCWDKTHSKKT